MDCILQSKTLCKNNKTGFIYEVININYVNRTVTVIGTKVNNSGETKEIIDKVFSFDEVEIMIPTGKMDSFNRDILEYDTVLYGEKFQFKGKVKYNDDRMRFDIYPADKELIKAGGTQVLSDISSQYIHIVSDRLNFYERIN